MSLKINFGCGQTPTKGWINIDNSFALKLAKLPNILFLFKFFKLINKSQISNIEFNKSRNIIFADATKKFPFKSNVADVIYSSHMLEHLSRHSASHFIKECYRVLKKGGILRIVVPDLKKLIDTYLIDKDADKFLDNSLLVSPSIETFKEKIIFLIIGYRHHQWMYDSSSLHKLISNQGFNNIVEQIPGSTLIEKPDSLNLSERANESFYIEAIK